MVLSFKGKGVHTIDQWHRSLVLFQLAGLAFLYRYVRSDFQLV
jgi:hypothetical protein